MTYHVTALSNQEIDVPRGFTLVSKIVNVISMIIKVKDSGEMWLIY